MDGDLLFDRAFDAGMLTGLRAAIQAHARRAGMEEERAMEVVLAVHELMANAIRHGAGKGRLRVWQADGALRCRVDDEGGPGLADPGVPVVPCPVRPGHGLWVVRQVADQMEVLSGPGGTRATVAFALPSDPGITHPPGPAPTGPP
jgi:anti-sigma regulatory factor (Ser/Thr protein kinase)